MRRFALLLCAVLLAAGVSVPIQAVHVTPAHALGSRCNALEDEDTVYEDTSLRQYKTTRVFDSYPYGPSFHWVDTDIKTYHIGHSGDCFRGYYVSDWLEDGTTAYLRAHLRVRACGTLLEWDAPQTATTNWRVITTGTWPCNWVAHSVTMWDGTVVTMTFGSYGDYGPQGDNYGSYAYTNTWYNPPAVYADYNGSQYWYVHIGQV